MFHTEIWRRGQCKTECRQEREDIPSLVVEQGMGADPTVFNLKNKRDMCCQEIWGLNLSVLMTHTSFQSQVSAQTGQVFSSQLRWYSKVLLHSVIRSRGCCHWPLSSADSLWSPCVMLFSLNAASTKCLTHWADEVVGKRTTYCKLQKNAGRH